MFAAAVIPVAILLGTTAGSSSSQSPSPSTPRVFTNTSEVTALAAVAGTLWVATRGGLEEYDLATLVRRRLYTTADGLAANEVTAVASAGQGVVARTEKADCVRRGGGFACSSAAHAPTLAAAAKATAAPPVPAVFAGVRETARLTVAGRTFIGTAGRGLWLAGQHPTALTPDDQICSNHVVAVARFRGDVWLGTFDQGLCAFDGHAFRRARVPFRMVNDLVATSTALFVASTRGLFRSSDGVHFQKVAALDGRGITDLALDGAGDRQTLWAVSPAALWRIPLGASGRLRGYFLPGGSHALQAVDAAGATVWMASEDRGAIRFRHGQFQVFDRAAGLPTSWSVDVAATDDGGAYVATLRHGLVHLDADGRVQPVTQLPDRWLLHVSRDDRGALWVGTQGGAARVDPKSRTLAAAVTVDRLPNPCAHAIATVGDDTWFATEGGTAVYRRAQLPVPVGTNERSLVTRSLSSLAPSSR